MKTEQKRAFKNALYEQFARMSKALANSHRLELVDVLAQGERTVEELAREAALSIANASQHLQVLRAAQLVSVRREGLYAYYRLADDRVFRVWQALRELGEAQLAEVDVLVRSFLQERTSLQAVSAPELLQRVASGSSIVLDVRPRVEYQAGHLPGARSIPVAELAERLHELPGDRPVIAYCRGPYCVFADEAVALLQRQGYEAYRFAEGFPDWHARGWPIEIGQGASR